MKQIRRIPLNGTFELTVRCNLKCKMCLFRLDENKNKEIIQNELTAEQWIDMARQVEKEGTIKLLITGGEPLLRSDFCEIYESIYKMGFIITLYTNATLVTDKVMNLFRKYPPHTIGVTLYGSSPNIYERVCGNANAYGKAIEGIKRLSELPSRLDLRTTIIKDNVDDLKNMKMWVKDQFGDKASFNVSRVVTKPVRGGVADVASCRLTPQENAKLILGLTLEEAKKYLKNKDVTIEDIKYKLEDNNNDKYKYSLYGCDSGMNSYTISWDGKLLGCQMLSDAWNYPIRDGFKKAWDEFPTLVKPSVENEKCINCEDRNFCCTCVATRVAETGNVSGCPSYICDEVKELKKYFIYK